MPNVPLLIANWALKVHKCVEIELRSLAICSFRIMRSICSPDLDVYVFAVSTYAAHAQACSKGIVEVLQFKATVWTKVAPEST